jgi:hypothetical protein
MKTEGTSAHPPAAAPLARDGRVTLTLTRDQVEAIKFALMAATVIRTGAQVADLLDEVKDELYSLTGVISAEQQPRRPQLFAMPTPEQPGTNRTH